jgi:hypothetical protein
MDAGISGSEKSGRMRGGGREVCPTKLWITLGAERDMARQQTHELPAILVPVINLATLNSELRRFTFEVYINIVVPKVFSRNPGGVLDLLMVAKSRAVQSISFQPPGGGPFVHPISWVYEICQRPHGQ